MEARRLLAWNLRRLRTARGLSQEQLAADGGFSKAYIGELERARKAASVDMLEKLARLLGVPTADLLREPKDGEEPPKSLRGGRRSADAKEER